MPYEVPIDFTAPLVDREGKATPYFQQIIADLFPEVAVTGDLDAIALFGQRPSVSSEPNTAQDEAARAAARPILTVQPDRSEPEALRLRMPLNVAPPPMDPRLMAIPMVPIQFVRWVIPDVVANQGNYPPAVFRDCIFLDTTTNLWYYSNGSTWNQFGTFDDAYSGSWNGSTKGVTQNAVYDILNAVIGRYTPLFDFYSSVGNVGTGEDDLYSATLAAAQLATNGDKILVDMGGIYVTSATATRQIKFYFGGTAIFDTGALTLSLSSAWTIWAGIIRVSSSVIRYEVTLTTQGASSAAYTAVGELTGLTLANTQIVKITGEAAGVGAATNDIVATLGQISYSKAA